MSNLQDYYTKPKKKTKEKTKPPGNIRIFDDDVSVRDLVPENVGNTLDDDLNINEPIVAEFIDERPESVKQLEQYTNSKWKKIVKDDDDEKSIFSEIKSEAIDHGDDEDLEVPRIRQRNISQKTEKHIKARKDDEDSDIEIDRRRGAKKEEEEIDETKVRVRRKTEKEIIAQAKKEEKKQKYMEWGKGVAQKQKLEERIEEALHEAQKPLARYKDDRDLEDYLKKQEREDDPMLQYIKKKEEEEGGEKKPAKPRYKGPPAPQNRYGILPGYRWDGLDRSNGFEKRYYDSLSRKKAIEVEAYKWSVEDM